MKIAVIIAYHRESDAVLRRAIDSVLSQRVPATPFLISDGYPRDWLDSLPIRHVKLGQAHRDYGDTPRGLGGALAMREGFEAVSFLDADNIFLPDHLSGLCEAHGRTGAMILTCRRFFMRPDGARLEPRLPDEDYREHTDSSCYFLAGPAVALARRWLDIPPELSVIGDRIYWRMVQAAAMRMAHLPVASVGYTTLWEIHYAAAGESAPVGAKACIDPAPISDWWSGLGMDGRAAVRAQLGLHDFDVMGNVESDSHG